jgi:leucyl-tRNA synthetase
VETKVFAVRQDTPSDSFIAAHRAVLAVNNALEKDQFNVAIAQVRILSNILLDSDFSKIPQEEAQFAIQSLLVMLGLFCPHLCEELWEISCFKGYLFQQPWPQIDMRIIEQKSVRLAVQVNGKVRAQLDIPNGATVHEIEAQAISLPEIQKYLSGNPPKKVIVVPNRVVNIVC